MNSVKRKYLKRLLIGSAGLMVVSYLYTAVTKSSSIDSFQTDSSILFPFFKSIETLNIGDYLPKDQGGKFVQAELLNTEKDEKIVEAIRNGLLNKVYGDPIEWGKLEKTELEKSVWLNRFYFLPSFARLYYLTGDKTYLNDMMAILRRWIADNPRYTDNPTSKYNWYDMQVAWRAIHFSWCFFLSEEGLSDEDKKVIFKSLTEHAEILLDGFGHQNLNEFNHQAHGALAMLYLGVLFPSLPEAQQLKDHGIRILEHHIDKAFYNDGGNVEQMFGYYPFEASIFRDAFLLCRENGINPPKNVKNLLLKMANYLAVISQPDGNVPVINDSYPMPVQPALNSILEILGRDPVRNSIRASQYFEDSQIGVMRTNSASNQSWYLLVNPAKTIGAHAHAGRLGFNLWYGKHPLIIESGCCSYDNPLLVKWYRTSRAHNTVLIDGVSDKATSEERQWAVKRKTQNRIEQWIEKVDYKLVQMNSPASEASNNSVQWNRQIAIIKERYVLVYDHFVAEETHDYEILFHLPASDVKVSEQQKRIIMGSVNPASLIPADRDMYSRVEVNNGYIYSDRENISAPVVSYHAEGKDVHSFILIAPENDGKNDWKISRKVCQRGIGLTVEYPSGEKDIVLIKNPGADSFTFQNKTTSDLMAVF
jgi:hypothetical protein